MQSPLKRKRGGGKEGLRDRETGKTQEVKAKTGRVGLEREF